MRSKTERICVAPPRILLVIGCLLGGGAERVLSDMANYWARKGWSIAIATWSSPEVGDFYEIDSRVNRVWLDGSHPGRSVFGKLKFNFSRVFRLRKLLAELEPDAVLSFINTSNVLTILATVGLKTKIVVSED